MSTRHRCQVWIRSGGLLGGEPCGPAYRTCGRLPNWSSAARPWNGLLGQRM